MATTTELTRWLGLVLVRLPNCDDVMSPNCNSGISQKLLSNRVLGSQKFTKPAATQLLPEKAGLEQTLWSWEAVQSPQQSLGAHQQAASQPVRFPSDQPGAPRRGRTGSQPVPSQLGHARLHTPCNSHSTCGAQKLRKNITTRRPQTPRPQPVPDSQGHKLNSKVGDENEQEGRNCGAGTII